MKWPLPIPAWFWTWARWYLGRSEFKGHARDPRRRPKAAPARIPAWAWARLKLIARGLPAPKPKPPSAKPLPPIHFWPSPNQSARTTRVDLVVVHRPVGSYAGSAAYLREPRAQASAHIILGRKSRSAPLEATQLVPWGRKAWACVAFNSRSDNLEISDDAWNGGGDAEALQQAARIVAFRLHRRGLPAVWARDGSGKGFCRHYDLGAEGGGHSDPTTSTAEWLRFVKLVQRAYKDRDFPATWGVE